MITRRTKPLWRLVPAAVRHRVPVSWRRRLLGTSPPPRRRPASPAPAAPAPRAAVDQTVELVLPSRDGAAGARTIVMRAPRLTYVPRRLERSGLAGYEPESLACFLAALDTVADGAVFDVGANVGIYALLAGALTDREVRAFEPTPDLADLARRFAGQNDIDIVVEELALGRERGTATLYLSDLTDSSNSLNPEFRPHTRSIDVPVETLDGYVQRTGARPALLKVDTETTEADVLAGATEVVRRHRPVIFCEVLHGRRETDLHAVVAEFGYTWYHLDGAPPYEPREQIVGDPTHQHLMWLFAPEPLGSEFWDLARLWGARLAATPVPGA